jgi:hypothetical protein
MGAPYVYDISTLRVNNSTMNNIYDISEGASIVRKSNWKEHGVIV